MNLIYLIFGTPLTVYMHEYGEPFLYFKTLYKLRYYLFHVWDQMSRYFIILTCIDRFSLTNMSANGRM
jgi:hypothetical protein